MAVPVVFAIHDQAGRYWPNLAVALESVLQHASQPQRVWVLHDETLSDPAKAALQRICSAHAASLTLAWAKLPAPLALVDYGAFSPASIFRLGIPSLFKDEEQVVYLDADLIFHGVDVSELVESAGSAPLAAVLDPYIGRPVKHRTQLAELGLESAAYFNSGVLVMRPKQLRQDLIARFMAFCKAHPLLSHPDQDFLNVQFKGQWAPLEARFNYQACAFDRSLFQPLDSYRGKVIHYAGKLKPLQGALAPAFVPFWMYAQGVPEAAEVFDSQQAAMLEPDPKTTDLVRIRRLH